VRATTLAAAVALSWCGACKQAAPPANEPVLERNPALTPRCVYFKDLRDFLPVPPPGFRQTHDEGSTGKYGEVQVSEAKRTFAKPEGQELAVRIVDTTMAPDLGRAIRAAVRDAADRSKDDPTAPLLLEQAVGFVRREPRGDAEPHAEATLWVADQFVVTVTSQGLEGTDDVRHLAMQLDLAGLAKLRLDGSRRNP
jgi:hypothetical protein